MATFFAERKLSRIGIDSDRSSINTVEERVVFSVRSISKSSGCNRTGVPPPVRRMALHSLISSQFPRDYLGIVGFSEVARVLKAEQLPEVSWDFVYGTNMQHRSCCRASCWPASRAPSRSS